MKETEAIIKLKNINKTYNVRDDNSLTIRERILSFGRNSVKRKIHALRNINLEIYKGEIFGIIGKNGSGKSSLLQILNGVYPHDKGGYIEVYGKSLRLALGLGFNPEFPARQNIYINGSLLGLSFKQIGENFDKIIQFSELEDFVDTKIKYYSSGMVSRLAFAIAMHVQADIFLMDEFFGGVGDYVFQAKSDKVFQSAFLEGKTIIYVSHSLDNILKYCNRVLLLDKGNAVLIDTPETVISRYKSLI